MRHKNIHEVNQKWLDTVLTSSSILVDATAGNGHDTLYCAQRVAHVYAFDIQQDALVKTQEKTAHLSNITYILDSHANLSNHLTSSIDGILFNLGYLPSSDKKLITKPSSTLSACTQALNLLHDSGFILITCYLGHAGGKEEADAIKLWIESHFTFYESYTYEGVTNAPISYFIKKKNRVAI